MQMVKPYIIAHLAMLNSAPKLISLMLSMYLQNLAIPDAINFYNK